MQLTLLKNIMVNFKVDFYHNYLHLFSRKKEPVITKSINPNALNDNHPYTRLKTDTDAAKETQVSKGVFHTLKKTYDFLYAKNPVTEKRQFWFVPTYFENFLGYCMYSTYVNNQGGISFNSNRQKLVNRVGSNLAKQACRNLGYEFTVIRSRNLNAWALPWGKIAVLEGLVKAIEEAQVDGFRKLSKDDKIAAILSHEIVHADARHTARRLEKIFIINILLIALRIYITFKTVIGIKEDTKDKFAKLKKYQEVDIMATYLLDLCIKLYLLATSREQELEADRYGMYLMKKAGYKPEAAVWLQKFFIARQLETPRWIVKVNEIFSSHPSCQTRLNANLKTLEEIKSRS